MSSQSNQPKRRMGKAAYFAIRSDVEGEIQKGACLAEIYAQHRERLPFSYSQFARYVQRYSESFKIKPPGAKPYRRRQ